MKKTIITIIMGILILGTASAIFLPSIANYNEELGVYYLLQAQFRPWVAELLESIPAVDSTVQDSDGLYIQVNNTLYAEGGFTDAEILITEIAVQEKLQNINYNTRLYNPKELEYWKATNGQLVVCGILEQGGAYNYACFPV